MKGKLIIILFLLGILILTVYKMMQFETSLRQEKSIKMYVEDETKPLIEKISAEELHALAGKSDYNFLADGTYFKKLKKKSRGDTTSAQWDPLFFKGVNLGVAVPGKFPSEFSLTYEEYLDWFRLIGEMNANLVRIYTILPPDFYDAFAAYNLHHQDKPLYLMQGVWTEVPESEDYFEPKYNREFQKEIINAVDVIHGKAVLKEQRGKAAGTYSTDISKYVSAILLGREWEPASVYKTNQKNKITNYAGDFVCMNNGNAMEAWLASIMDFTALYETYKYQYQHPLSFVNWLPLDPIFHNTEIIENERVKEYDNDLESIDFSRYHSTELFTPGIFAAYHVYPYYPDFIYLQESYTESDDTRDTKNTYLAYLKDLKQKTGNMPLVLAEYGLPSSRGNSHISPFGYHQGGHSEAEQAQLSIDLTKDIVASDCAGAIYFEWIDEWFKHNWLVTDFEIPVEDCKLWHNMENPEQNFGIVAMENKIKVINGKLNDWDEKHFKGDKVKIMADADAGYFYLALKIPDFNMNQNKLYVAIDTYDKEKGDHKLPFTDKVFSNGFEFLAVLNTEKDAALLVDEPYSVFNDSYNNYMPGFRSQKNSNGRFIRQLMLSNRCRFSLLGKETDSLVFDRSPLEFGNSSLPATSNADWYYNAGTGVFEIRLDWALLNVSDPAKHYVLDDKPGTRGFEYSKTDAFRIYTFITDKNDKVIRQYPEKEPFKYTWEGWEMPTYQQRLKPLYYSLRDYFREPLLPQNNPLTTGQEGETFTIANFYNNKAGAISISFDDAAYSQYQYALPVLNMYHLPASFGVVPGLVDNAANDAGPNIPVKRLGSKEIREIAGKHEIAIQVNSSAGLSQAELLSFSKKFNIQVQALHLQNNLLPAAWPRGIVFARKYLPDGQSMETFGGVKYLLASSSLATPELYKVLTARENNWTVLVYHHLYKDLKEIPSNLNKNRSPGMFIQTTEFERQMRLLRNSDYWIATEGSVLKYQKEKGSARIKKEQFKNIVYIKIQSELDENIYKHPLTITYRTKAKKVRITGSETDGTYQNRDGIVLFNALPNKEITIEIIN